MGKLMQLLTMHALDQRVVLSAAYSLLQVLPQPGEEVDKAEPPLPYHTIADALIAVLDVHRGVDMCTIPATNALHRVVALQSE